MTEYWKPPSEVLADFINTMNIADTSWENSQRTEAAVPAILDPTSSAGACNPVGTADVRKNPKMNAR
jgi:hypothetical protein